MTTALQAPQAQPRPPLAGPSEYDTVAIDPRFCRPAKAGGQVLVVTIENYKSGGKTLVADALMSAAERRIRQERIPSLGFHLHEIESEVRLNGKFAPMFSTDFDELVPSRGMGEDDNGQLPSPLRSFRARLVHFVPMLIDVGANGVEAVDALFREFNLLPKRGFVRARIVVVSATHASVTGATRILTNITKADEMKRVIIIRNFAETEYARVAGEDRADLEAEVARLEKAGALVVSIKWGSTFPQAGVVTAFGELARSQEVAYEILGVEEAIERLTSGGDQIDPAESERQWKIIRDAEKTHKWAVGVMAQAGRILDRLEALHQEAGGTLFDPARLRTAIVDAMIAGGEPGENSGHEAA